MSQKEGGSRSANKTSRAATGKTALAPGENKTNLPHSSSQLPAFSVFGSFWTSSGNSQA